MIIILIMIIIITILIMIIILILITILTGGQGPAEEGAHPLHAHLAGRSHR